jgi:hypothetical protein
MFNNSRFLATGLRLRVYGKYKDAITLSQHLEMVYMELYMLNSTNKLPNTRSAERWRKILAGDDRNKIVETLKSLHKNLDSKAACIESKTKEYRATGSSNSHLGLEIKALLYEVENGADQFLAKGTRLLSKYYDDKRTEFKDMESLAISMEPEAVYYRSRHVFRVNKCNQISNSLITGVALLLVSIPLFAVGAVKNEPILLFFGGMMVFAAACAFLVHCFCIGSNVSSNIEPDNEMDVPLIFH